MKRFLTLFGFALFSLAIAQGAFATSYTTTTIQHPGSIYTYADSVNDYGIVAGHYITDEIFEREDGSLGGILRRTGYVFDGTNFVDISIPNANTVLTGLNNKGDLIGYYYTDDNFFNHAFMYSSGVLTSLDFPGAQNNYVSDINRSGQVLGAYSIDANTAHQYLYESGNFSIIDAQFPGAERTSFSGIIGLVEKSVYS